MTPQEASDKLDRISRNLKAEMLAAEKDALDKGVRLARIWSSGTYTSAQLAGLGHPFRRGGPGLGDPALINRQSGMFYAAWKSERARVEGGAIKSRVYNDAPWARYLESGTRKMIARPIKEKVQGFLRPILLDGMQQAIRRAFRG